MRETAKARSTPYQGSCTFQYSQQNMAMRRDNAVVARYHQVGESTYECSVTDFGVCFRCLILKEENACHS